MNRPFEICTALYPFASRWMRVDGIPIHYVDEGSGPTLLLLHGNFMWSFSYRRLIAEMAKTHRVIAIDLAGMGMSGKPHKLGQRAFGYSYAEQSALVENIILQLDLHDTAFLSFDHGAPIGFGVMVRQPERFSRIVIANSWAWSCHDYRATRIWSTLAPLSKRLLRRLMLDKKRWLFEDRRDLKDPAVWQACTAPYADSADFRPMAGLAGQLTKARSYFNHLEAHLPALAGKQIDVIWSTKGGGLFPEFVEEPLFLARWRAIYPDAPVTILPNIGYYELVTRPPDALLDLLRKAD